MMKMQQFQSSPIQNTTTKSAFATKKMKGNATFTVQGSASKNNSKQQHQNSPSFSKPPSKFK